MRGRDFLDPAHLLMTGATEPYWRAAAVHAYYALLLECRDALLRWGSSIPRGAGIHAHVRLRFTYATDPDLKRIGQALDELVKLRNVASYQLAPSAHFASPARAQRAIQEATNALALLDQIDTDPARRAAAIASLPP